MDRKKELKKQYLETYKRKGVYSLKNKINGKRLIDRSLDLDKIKNRILFELQLGSSYFKELQQDYKELGKDQFEFEILEEIKEQSDPDFDYADKLEELKEKYLGIYQSFGENGYNHGK